MAETRPFGDGFRRTSTGRSTYWPSGIDPSTGNAPMNTTQRLSNAPTLHDKSMAPNRSASSGMLAEKEDLADSSTEYDEKDKHVNSAGIEKTTTSASRRSEQQQAPPRRSSSRSSAKSNDEDKDVEKGDASKEGDDKEEKDPNLITWDGDDDPGNPQNWPTWRKWIITLAFSATTLVVTFASSVFSTAFMPTAAEFGVSEEVMTLGLSLFVCGFAVGPIIWGPMSELYGRKMPLFLGFFLFAIFQIPVAVAVNLETIFLCRFFGGVFGSAPLAIVGGALGDLWDPVERGVAICLFAGATFVGPVFGPIIGSFITASYLGWRWTEWITLIMACSFGLIAFFIVPETYAPILLHKRAKKIRYETKNWAIRAEYDEEQITPKQIITNYIFRPIQMLFAEPILILVTIYMSLIYGILYLFFEAYPIAFSELRGWSSGVGSLPFIAIIFGVAIGCGIIIWTTKTRFKRKMEEEGHVVPEERLIPMIIGGFAMPAGLFWFAWTSDPNIIWVPQVLSGGLFGAGVLLIFMQGLNYIIDCYMINANSAIAANTFMRSLVGGGFPMFATAMYHNLGVDWATSLLGFLCAALFPVPILFYFYGEKLRSYSKFVPK